MLPVKEAEPNKQNTVHVLGCRGAILSWMGEQMTQVTSAAEATETAGAVAEVTEATETAELASDSSGDAPGGRASTEAALEEAAMSLLERDGVLAGLNLREVADEAGVNRGLVYHYFGSRGKLLRRALRRRGESSLQKIREIDRVPLADGQLRLLRTLLGDPEPVKLRTLLLIDGTERMKMMPLRERTQGLLSQAVQRGELDADLDRHGVHAFLVTAIYGYVLYREAFASEMGVALPELDESFAEVYERAVRSLAPPPAGPQQRGAQ